MKNIFFLLSVLLPGFLLAQDGDMPPPPPDTSAWQTVVMIVIAILFFYFILWRPEQQKRKELEEKRGNLKKGDRVVAMGIIGVVNKVEDETVILRMYDGSKLEFLKIAITEVLGPES